jgi:hypothetical protein
MFAVRSVDHRYARPMTAPTAAGSLSMTDADKIEVAIDIKTIQKLDPISQTVTLSVKSYTQWFDPRLAFDVTNVDTCVIGSLSPGGKSRVLLNKVDYKNGPSKRIWTPDIYVVNSISETIRCA